MNYRHLRTVLILCALLTQIVTIAAYIDVLGFGAPPWYGHAGVDFSLHYKANTALVASVEPGGPADRAGLRKGDLVDISRNTPLERWQWFTGFLTPMNGTPTTLAVQRAHHALSVTITPDRWDLRRYWFFWLGPAGIFLAALIGALIAWRAEPSNRNLSLAATLVFFAAGTLAATQNFAFPSVMPYLATALVSTLLPLSAVAWIVHATTFGRPLSRTRVVVGAAAALIFLYVACMVIGEALALTTLWAPPGSVWFSLLIPNALGVGLTVVCSVLAIRATGAAERPRAAWSLVPLSLFFVGYQVFDYLPNYSSDYTLYVIGIAAFNVNLIAMPAILAYATLARRLVDIGFVLNRAAVFALVSAVLIGAFILIEYTLGSWLAGMTHTTSAIVGAAIALALGLSLQFVHHHVDRIVDRIFFRKRHEDERALRNFAFEASFITDRDALLARTVDVVERHIGARGASVAFPGIDIWENDPAIVALRAWGKPLDLRSTPATTVNGDYAFPMLARGSLVAVLICAEKESQEAYASDEIGALQTLAHAVGLALDGMTPEPADGLAVLRAEIREMRSAIVAELQAMRDRPSLRD